MIEHTSRQLACCYWLTGLSGAGKTTTAIEVMSRLVGLGHTVIHLDGDELRAGLNSDLGFTRADRQENVRRIAAIARLLVDAGLVVLVSVISPYRVDRDAARWHIGKDRCFEVHVDASLESCRRRDPKGLYARAAAGELTGLTGVHSPYEAPHAPALTIRTETQPVDSAADAIVRHYLETGSATNEH